MVFLKTHKEIELLKKSGSIVYEVLYKLKSIIKPGVRTLDLDKEAEKIANRRGAFPGFKNYNGFPFSLCTSINDVVIHGLPSKTILLDGDIISLDFGILLNSYYGDAAITVPVGNITRKDKELIDVTEKSLYKGIATALPGKRLSDISYAIQSYVESKEFSLVRGFGGHGLGRNLHEPPYISNLGKPNEGVLLKSGMVIAIEPMVIIGDYRTKTLDDGWSVAAIDGSNTAHFEHTIVITDNGPLILTK